MVTFMYEPPSRLVRASSIRSRAQSGIPPSTGTRSATDRRTGAGAFGQSPRCAAVRV